jgi:hypothetical protein
MTPAIGDGVKDAVTASSGSWVNACYREAVLIRCAIMKKP